MLHLYAFKDIRIQIENRRNEVDAKFAYNSGSEVVQKTNVQKLGQKINLLEFVGSFFASSRHYLVEFLDQHVKRHFRLFCKQLGFFLSQTKH